MLALRSLLFALFLVIITPACAILGILSFPLPSSVRRRIVVGWAPMVVWLAWHLLGIHYRVIGREHIPIGPAVILSKHQSAWETMALQVIFPPLCFVFKRELLKVPFFGWGLALTSGIAIDRSAAKDALTQVVEQGRARLAEGFWVVVFPEGTRVEPGATRRYQPGGARLAQQAQVPVLPVAHNAGEFWQRDTWLKMPGEIVISIGPAIVPGEMDANEINLAARDWIEAEMCRLFPHHYAATIHEAAAS